MRVMNDTALLPDNRVSFSSVNNVRQYGQRCMREMETDALKPVSMRLRIRLCGVDMEVDVHKDGRVTVPGKDQE
jgi:hypothetical protein